MDKSEIYFAYNKIDWLVSFQYKNCSTINCYKFCSESNCQDITIFGIKYQAVA